MMKSCFLGLFPSPHLSSRGYDITSVNMYVCVANVFTAGHKYGSKITQFKRRKENKIKHKECKMIK